ncbi:MAG TPA: hypothetical protein VF598_12195 [Hymenobacter sp.]
MRCNFFFALLLLLLPLVSCEKEDAAPNDDTEFVPGELLLGTKETTSLPQAFSLLNSRPFSILSISTPIYTSAMPADSLGYIERTLNAKSYVNDGIWKAHVYQHALTGTLTITARLMNMSRTNQQDWLATVQKLRLQEQPNSYTSYHLKVPVGEEKKWVKELQQQSEVRWAELNNIIHIELY